MSSLAISQILLPADPTLRPQTSVILPPLISPSALRRSNFSTAIRAGSLTNRQLRSCCDSRPHLAIELPAQDEEDKLF
jgi:hypothetical protein